MEQQRFTYLLEQYRTGQLTPAEGEELLKTVQTDDDAWLVDNIASLMAMEAEIPAVVDEQVVQSNINRVLAIDKGARVRKVRTYRWAAAAAIALVLAGAGYTLLKQNPSVKDTVATIPVPDVAPATGKATLVLADGSSVALDEDSVRAIRQGILQKGGELIYENTAGNAQLSYNTLSTPRGGQFRATLPDGSKVWLNAASSITYPTAFGDKERRVQVKGEVYIEVAENAQLPFFLNASPVEIAVLGTAFNVSAYEDETHITTTLVSGSIAVNAGGRATPVKPGQQAAYANGVFQLKEQADVEQATAWKKGVFYFKDAGLDVVLRELARWYDVQVVYEGVVPRRSFRGEIGRDLSLQQVLKGLGDMGVKFRIEDGRRLVVTP